MATNTMGRAYHALNGKEAMELILAEIRRQLCSDPDFNTAHTFREVSWQWNLTIQGAAPAPAQNIIIGGKLLQHDPATNKPVPAQESEEPILLEVTSSRNIDKTVPPDKVREEAGLPCPQPRTTKRGETVDVTSEVLIAEREAADKQQEMVNKIMARPDADVIRQVQEEVDPKKRSMLAEAAHKRGIVIPVPVRDKVHDVHELARDVTETMTASLGLSENGAVKLEGSPETRFSTE